MLEKLFFAVIFLVALCGAFIPVLFGKPHTSVQHWLLAGFIPFCGFVIWKTWWRDNEASLESDEEDEASPSSDEGGGAEGPDQTDQTDQSDQPDRADQAEGGQGHEDRQHGKKKKKKRRGKKKYVL